MYPSVSFPIIGLYEPLFIKSFTHQEDEYAYTVVLTGRGKVYGIPDVILIEVPPDELEVIEDEDST